MGRHRRPWTAAPPRTRRPAPRAAAAARHGPMTDPVTASAVPSRRRPWPLPPSAAWSASASGLGTLPPAVSHTHRPCATCRSRGSPWVLRSMGTAWHCRSTDCAWLPEIWKLGADLAAGHAGPTLAVPASLSAPVRPAESGRAHDRARGTAAGSGRPAAARRPSAHRAARARRDGPRHLGISPAAARSRVKMMHPQFAGDTSFRERFKREAEVAMRVSGLFTAKVVDSGLTTALPGPPPSTFPGRPWPSWSPSTARCPTPVCGRSRRGWRRRSATSIPGASSTAT